MIPVAARQCRAHGRRGGCQPLLTREWKIQEKFFTQVSCPIVHTTAEYEFHPECVSSLASLFSEFTHGLLFNLLYKAVRGSSTRSDSDLGVGKDSGSRWNTTLNNDFINSLAVHLLELAVTYPQEERFSGKVYHKIT